MPGKPRCQRIVAIALRRIPGAYPAVNPTWKIPQTPHPAGPSISPASPRSSPGVPGMDSSGSERKQSTPEGEQPLSELHRILKPLPNSSHSRDRQKFPPDSNCLKGTREAVIREISDWATKSKFLGASEDSHIMWLHGCVGCGKSAIAQIIAERFFQKKRLAGSFFFFRGSCARSKIERLASTIACQLAAAVPSAGPYITSAARTHYGLLANYPLGLQFQHLVYEPLMAITKWSLFSSPFLIVIDGLDECYDRSQVARWITDTVEYFKAHPRIALRFLITSRAEEHIREGLTRPGVRLLNLADHNPMADIVFVMRETLKATASSSRVIQAYEGQWPEETDLQRLVNHAGGLFTFMSTILKFILDNSNPMGPNPMARLPHALTIDPGLDGLYTETLAHAEHLPHFREVTSTIGLLQEPLSINDLAELIVLPRHEVVQVLVPLQSIIHVPGDNYTLVTLCHSSFYTYLNQYHRSGRFYAPPSGHLDMLKACFRSLYNDTESSSSSAYAQRATEAHWKLLLASLPEEPDGRGFEAQLELLISVLQFDVLDLRDYNLVVYLGVLGNILKSDNPDRKILHSAVAGLLQGMLIESDPLVMLLELLVTSNVELPRLHRRLEQESQRRIGVPTAHWRQIPLVNLGVAAFLKRDGSGQIYPGYRHNTSPATREYICTFWLQDLLSTIEQNPAEIMEFLVETVILLPPAEPGKVGRHLEPEIDFSFQGLASDWETRLRLQVEVTISAINRLFKAENRDLPNSFKDGRWHWEVVEGVSNLVLSDPDHDSGPSILDMVLFFDQLSLCVRKRCHHEGDTCGIEESWFASRFRILPIQSCID
ncbi:hypothetical protein DFP72DRAFT_1115335 [Ephemerocybe angulata]|uniref:Nephrocystin 3-like N-terminal domain-containing protein n=1 Tax=Ephemerocybe angulata TaxID=980116 RepID=A0A8H6I0U5_9AGAR|nr:hypothetical protein DFP72DRAFT_1115335 [Tulosesus angulatus]